MDAVGELKPPAISLDNVTIELRGETIIKSLSFEVGHRDVVCLFGPSGCGKTTVLRAISGILPIASGSIKNSFSRTVPFFQSPRLLPWRTAWENIALVEKNVSKEQIAALLLSLGLEEKDWSKYPQEMSGGMCQRVSLARAMITNPDLLLIDEPFSALDFERKLSLQKILNHHVQERGLSMILVTHDRYDALKMANRIYLLGDKPTRLLGEINLSPPPADRDAAYIESELNKWRASDV